MSILKFTGSGTEMARNLADALRNSFLSNGKGAILVDKAPDHDNEKAPTAKAMIEKILAGTALPNSVEELPPIEKLAWKKDPVIILVGEGEKWLDEFEKTVPGFVEFHGPINTMEVNLAPSPKQPARPAAKRA